MYKLIKCNNRSNRRELRGFLIATEEAWLEHLKKAREFYRVDPETEEEPDDQRYSTHYVAREEIEIYGYYNYVNQFTVVDVDGIELAALEKGFRIEVNTHYYLDHDRWGDVLILNTDDLDGET